MKYLDNFEHANAVHEKGALAVVDERGILCPEGLQTHTLPVVELGVVVGH